jgi:hypothetical protein
VHELRFDDSRPKEEVEKVKNPMSGQHHPPLKASCSSFRATPAQLAPARDDSKYIDLLAWHFVANAMPQSTLTVNPVLAMILKATADEIRRLHAI